MARYFAANTVAGFAHRSHSSVVDSNTAGYFDPAYTDSAILVPAGSSTGSSVETGKLHSSPLSLLYGKFDVRAGGGLADTNDVTFALRNSSGALVLRLSGRYSNNYSLARIQTWNGSAWVDRIAPIPVSWHTEVTPMSWHLDAQVGGKFWLRVGDTVYSLDGDFSMCANIDQLRLEGSYSGNRFSQVMVADYDVTYSKLMKANINANGTFTDGSGAATDINETGTDDVGTVRLTTASQKRTFTRSAVTIPTGFNISALTLESRMRRAGSSPTGNLLVRSGTSENSAAASSSTAFSGRTLIVETDPNTSVAWDQTTFNAAQVGFEAV